MKRFVLSIAAFVGLVTGCQAASPSFSSFYTNHFTTNGLVIKANLNPTQFDTNSSSITITITNVAGISGGSHWTNPIGVLQPRSGQTTNALLFISASSDNATNSAFTVDTVNTWTDIDARLIQGRIQGTNLFGVSPFGTVSVGRGVGGIWYAPDESDVFAGVRDKSRGESEYAALHFAAIDHQDATNYATYTTTLRSGTNASGVSTFRAVVDGSISEVTMQAQPYAGVARLEVANMGDTTFSVFDNAGTFVHNMLWAVDGFAMVPSLTTNLVAGVNELETMNEGVILLTGPTTNPADTIVNLGDGNGVGNFFVLINNAQNSAFTLQDGDPLWDNPLAFQRLNGNWVSTNRGDSIWLFNNGWFITEIGRISGNTNVSAPVVMNPTDNYLPRRQSEGVFNDSPLATPGGSTNTLASGALILGGTNSFDYLGGFFDGLAMGFFSDTDRGQSGAWNQILGGGSASGNQAYMDLGGNANSSQASATVTVGADTYASAVNIQSPLNASGHYTSWNSTNLLALRPFINDGANLYAYVFDTSTGLATTGLASFRNGATNMLNIGPTGQIIFGPGTTNVLARTNDYYLAYFSTDPAGYGLMKFLNSSVGAYQTDIGKSPLGGIITTTGTQWDIGVGTRQLTFDAQGLYPSTGNVVDLGSNSANFESLYLGTSVIFGPGTTNVLYRSGSSLVATNGSTTNAFTLRNGLGTGFHMTYNVGGNPKLLSDSGSIYFGSTLVAEANILPSTDNSKDIGSSASNGSFKDLFQKGIHYLVGANDGSGNATWLKLNHTGNAGSAIYNSDATGTQTFRDHTFQIGGTNVMRIDRSASAGETRFWLYDEDNGTMERVTVGAADSGGAGFKVLRIPN